MEILEIGDCGTSSQNNHCETIERVDSNHLTYDEFFRCYMAPNVPVILESIPNEWECYNNWFNTDRDNLNIDYLKEKIGNIDVPVANCSAVEYNAHRKETWKFFDYLDYWSNRTKGLSNEESIYYLKDWHLRQALPDYDFYKLPKYFGSDWLNEYLLETKKEDYRFVYIGPKDSWTPFHADVYSSYSWSVNIFGIKKWILLPPGEESKLLSCTKKLPFSIDASDLNNKNIKYFEITQMPGETIFVPSCWYHQVMNVTDTVSVNHNWFNGCNIEIIWKSLQHHNKLVENEIADCRDMENYYEQCQLILKADYGLSYSEFLEIIEFISNRRKSTSIFCDYSYGPTHTSFDLNTIDKVKQLYNETK